MVGWRFVNERRAINLDANCGWARGKADVLYVADAFAVMREMNRLLVVASGAAILGEHAEKEVALRRSPGSAHDPEVGGRIKAKKWPVGRRMGRI